MQVIRADTIEAAVERILDELKDTRRSRNNAIYFDGWDGLGASAVLRAVAQRLTARPTGLEFEQIIHIDCSKWESRRAMQRAIVEQLKLPSWVMDMFDKQDEEDDFEGVDQGSRAELAQVVRKISQAVQNRKFLVILHNGSNEEIDILKLGLSLDGCACKKMLWTFRGRFRLDPKMRDKVTNSTVLSASRHERDPQELWSYLVHQEATDLVAHHGKHDGITVDDSAAATQVVECLLYMLERSYISQHIIDYGWALHASNHLVCDGIILTQQQQEEARNDGVHEAAWQVGDALHRDMELYIDYLSNKLPLRQQAARKEEADDLLDSHMKRSAERRPCCISTTTCGFVLSPAGVIPSSMFRHSDRLGVLKLSWCTFRFSSPPFLCCHSLRFLWLDQCQDQDLLLTRSSKDHHHADAEKEDNTTNRSLWACFESLWVLDLRHTDWDRILSPQMMDLMTQLRELNIMGAKNCDMSHFWGRLHNIRKLRVTKSTCCNYSSSFLSGMERMELLDFSGNHTTQGQGGMTCLSGAAGSSSLKTVIIDDCVGLQKITLHSCAELKNLLLRGLFRNVEELDLSGTTLQTIDLSKMQIPDLKRLLLTGCEQLRAILWPPESKMPVLDVLRIDTTSRSASADGRGEGNLAAAATASLPSFKKWRISLTDARLLRSLSPVKRFFGQGVFEPGYCRCHHIDICPAAHLFKKAAHPANNIYDDSLVMWACPEKPLPSSNNWSCIIEMQVGQGSTKLLEGAQTSGTTSGVLLIPDFICDTATSLHVYDNSCITSIPAPPEGPRWYRLRWCRVERCPKLDTVFTTPQGCDVRIFYWLRTFWASQLPKALYVWKWPTSTAMAQYEGSSFEDLAFVHLDYCPKLRYVLPLSTRISSLDSLETLEIVCCNKLTEVFPLCGDPERQEKTIIRFPSLRRIHLHQLPNLQHICGHTMSAPNLETVNIRGCSKLTRLPAVDYDDKKTRPTVDCQEEWWGKLQWDGVKAKHHPSLYRPIHSQTRE